MGCFKDNMETPRPLPEELFNDRDEDSDVYSGILLNWETYDTYLPDAVCRCAKAAEKKGYSVFSMQFYGECWSGPEAAETYNINGEATSCINKTFGECQSDDKTVCTGVAQTNYVYGIEQPYEPTCNVAFEKLGCYKDNPLDRRMPVKILNARDSIDWNSWDASLAKIVCQCANKAKELKYSFFGVQFYGECWSGPEAGDSYYTMGPANEEKCLTYEYGTCPSNPNANSNECAGKEDTNYVYGIKIQNSAAPIITPPEEAEPKCSVAWQKIGCFKDDMVDPRPLPQLVVTDRDITSNVYSNTQLVWSKYGSYLPDAVCRCAKASKDKGYSTFSMQYYGECWSGPSAGETYKRNGVASTCINKEFKQCPADDKSVCTGEKETNYVYSIVVEEAKCDVEYQRVGCYHDFHNATIPRPLPEEILNERSEIDWGKWDAFMVKLICKCARIAQGKRFPYFGVQYYGECWSGAEGAETYQRDQESTECITKGFKACEASSSECVGKQYNNFVYKVPLIV